MTTVTTAGKARPPRRRRTPWGLIVVGASLLVHVVFWFALQPFGQTQMVFDLSQEEQRTAEVQKRELERQERERRRRQEQPLNREQVEKLKREAQRREKREIAQRLHELMEVREELEEVREKTFEQLQERTAEDVTRLDLMRLTRETRQLRGEVSRLARTKDLDSGENKRTSDAVKELNRQVDEMNKNPTQIDQALDQFIEQTQQLAQDLEAARTTARNVSKDRRSRARAAARQAEAVAELAQQLSAKRQDIDTINDTSSAKAPPPPRPIPPAEQLAAQDPAELYDQAAQLEQHIHDAHDDIRAAELAMVENTGFAQAQDTLNTTRPDRPELGQQLREQPISTVGDLNQFRQTLQHAAAESQDMALRSDSLLAQAKGLAARSENPGNRFARQAMMHRAISGGGRQVVDLTGLMGFNLNTGGEGDSSGMQADWSQGADMVRGTRGDRIQLPSGKVLAEAMPGRMFTQDSARAGWLYIDTWYIIGPWENHSQIDFDRVHPPEYEIDFDAEYTDGKYANKPGHPYQTLRWAFHQADHIRVEPPKVYGASTYYAYTEVFFDHDRDMLISIASDDAARVWVNGEVVWQDFGQSAWNLGEGYRRVPFRKGFNTILIRIENGPGKCVFSVLLCPPEALGKK